MTNHRPYREELFQWIWQQIEFDCTNVETTCGKSLKIMDTGSLNHGAGPDFLGAHLRIEGRDWYGSVEIHNKPGGWYQHEHHTDQAFNSVVLHVVYEDDGSKQVHTEDGHEPFTLVLKPYLTKKVYRLLQAKQKSGIACSGNISFINQEAFEKQVEIAHREYLEYKVEELLEYYDPSLSLSKAWKKCLITGIYQTLGIPSNRTQMKRLVQLVFSESLPSQDFYEFSEKINQIAFHSERNIPWNHSGMRPASRPKSRVKQAAALHYAVSKVPFSSFFKNDLEETWNELLERVDPANRSGKSRLSLIKQIVYLPALYLLGDLLQSTKVKQSAFEAWCSTVQHVPEEVKNPFKKAGFKINSTTKKIGLAHQYKRYCMEKNCHRCEVFKKAIRS